MRKYQFVFDSFCLVRSSKVRLYNFITKKGKMLRSVQFCFLRPITLEINFECFLNVYFEGGIQFPTQFYFVMSPFLEPNRILVFCGEIKGWLGRCLCSGGLHFHHLRRYNGNIYAVGDMAVTTAVLIFTTHDIITIQSIWY